MYGWFPGCQQYQDSDDKYTCPCGCKVEFASPTALRSLESAAQSKARLCSECLKKQKTEGLPATSSAPSVPAGTMKIFNGTDWVLVQ